MATSENSPEPNSNSSISSAEGSPARILAKPGSGPGLKDLAAAFGLSSPVLLGNFDPDGYSLRTCQASLFPIGTEEKSSTPLEYPEYSEGIIYMTTQRGANA